MMQVLLSYSDVAECFLFYDLLKICHLVFHKVLNSSGGIEF